MPLLTRSTQSRAPPALGAPTPGAPTQNDEVNHHGAPIVDHDGQLQQQRAGAPKLRPHQLRVRPLPGEGRHPAGEEGRPASTCCLVPSAGPADCLLAGSRHRSEQVSRTGGWQAQHAEQDNAAQRSTQSGAYLTSAKREKSERPSTSPIMEAPSRMPSVANALGSALQVWVHGPFGRAALERKACFLGESRPLFSKNMQRARQVALSRLKFSHDARAYDRGG